MTAAQNKKSWLGYLLRVCADYTETPEVFTPEAKSASGRLLMGSKIGWKQFTDKSGAIPESCTVCFPPKQINWKGV